jgi:hypothetical protein
MICLLSQVPHPAKRRPNYSRKLKQIQNERDFFGIVMGLKTQTDSFQI